jgi:hypothetical protein
MTQRAKTSRNCSRENRAGARLIVVACGGPSLERNLEDLRPWRERVVLVAEAAAARTLLSSDVMPDFVVALDPGAVEIQDLARIAAPGLTALVAEAAIHPAAFTGFNHRVFVFRTTDHSPWPWLKRMGFERTHVRGSGSATTCAFDLAHQMGADPVVLIGADAAGGNRDMDWLVRESNRPKMPRIVNATGAGTLEGGGIRRELLPSIGIREWIDADLARPTQTAARPPETRRRPRTGDRFDFHLLDFLITSNDWLVFDGTVEELACRAVSRFVPPLSRVLDLGVGHDALESSLPAGCVYSCGEMSVESSSPALADDASRLRLPDGKFDVVATLGLLDRIDNPTALLKSIFERAPLLVTSVRVGASCGSDRATALSRSTVRSLEAFVSMVQKAGWDLRVAEQLTADYDGETWVFALARR